jgi:hypothetical protein
MADYRLEPITELTATVPAAVEPPAPDDDFHCPNCLYLEDPTGGPGFWACQNLCVRD